MPRAIAISKDTLSLITPVNGGVTPEVPTFDAPASFFVTTDGAVPNEILSAEVFFTWFDTLDPRYTTQFVEIFPV